MKQSPFSLSSLIRQGEPPRFPVVCQLRATARRGKARRSTITGNPRKGFVKRRVYNNGKSGQNVMPRNNGGQGVMEPPTFHAWLLPSHLTDHKNLTSIPSVILLCLAEA